jgi:predicted transcriptional regulator
MAQFKNMLVSLILSGYSESIMVKPKKELQEEARRLRREGKSVNEIVAILGVAKSSVSIWVRDIQLTEDQQNILKHRGRQYGADNAGAQANIERFRTMRQDYQQTGREKAKENRPLHIAGCMLYWAEGSKNRHRMEFVNANPYMMQFFMRFLREEMNVENALIKINIHCHTNEPNEIQRITQYWLDLLQLPASCLRKISFKERSVSKRKQLANGVCGIRVESTELTHHILGAIQEYGGFDNPDWLF